MKERKKNSSNPFNLSQSTNGQGGTCVARVLCFIVLDACLFFTYLYFQHATVDVNVDLTPQTSPIISHKNDFWKVRTTKARNAIDLEEELKSEQRKSEWDCYVSKTEFMDFKIRSGMLPKKKILLIVENEDIFAAVGPLFTEFFNAKKSTYLPVLALSEEIQLSPANASKTLNWAEDINDLICLIHFFKDDELKPLQEIVRSVLPSALLSSIGTGFVPKLVGAISSEFNIPFVLLPPAQFSFVKWLVHCPLSVFESWYVPQVRLSIITATRPDMLQNLLRSLHRAYYLGDEVDIIINIDSIADQETVKVAYNFVWPHGHKHSRHRVQQGGLILQVTESWYPSSADEYVVFLEDDIEVSKYFYVWCRYNLMHYKYGLPENQEGGLFGISLYTPRKNELLGQRPRWNSTMFFAEKAGKALQHSPYIQPLPCSWGAMFFPHSWMKFHHYLQYRRSTGHRVYIPGSTTNGWEESWKRFFIEMAYEYDMYMLYPNFKNQTSFSTNLMGVGVHIKKTGGDETHLPIDFTVPLFSASFDEILGQLPEGTLPKLRKIPAISLLGDFVQNDEFTKYNRPKNTISFPSMK